MGDGQYKYNCQISVTVNVPEYIPRMTLLSCNKSMERRRGGQPAPPEVSKVRRLWLDIYSNSNINADADTNRHRPEYRARGCRKEGITLPLR